MKEIEKLKSALASAESIIIGAGAGLSTSAGFTYSGERFETYFSEFASKYGFCDMYSGGFAPFESLEEQWAYWSRYSMINHYMNPPKNVYEDLLNLVCESDYFVLTTNVDHCFQKTGFDKKRIFYTQGDYGLFQCSKPCHQKTYDNERQIRAMWKSQLDDKGNLVKLQVPTELIPTCPVCGRPMSMNLRADDTFVQDDGWYAAADRYENFLRTRHVGEDGKVLFLELGVGGNTPGIIKYPFWQMTAKNANATYACINYGEAIVPHEIAGRSICINGDIGEIIRKVGS